MDSTPKEKRVQRNQGNAHKHPHHLFTHHTNLDMAATHANLDTCEFHLARGAHEKVNSP